MKKKTNCYLLLCSVGLYQLCHIKKVAYKIRECPTSRTLQIHVLKSGSALPLGLFRSMYIPA